MVICSRTFTVSALSMSLPRQGWIPAGGFSDDMITPLASVLVNRLTGSRTIITRKMQTPPSLTYEQKLKLDDLAERLIASEEPVTILIDGHEAEISEYLIKKLPNAGS